MGRRLRPKSAFWPSATVPGIPFRCCGEASAHGAESVRRGAAHGASPEMINQALYHEDANPHLGAASYKVTHQTGSGRGVYSFCMCPGGYVVNASSEEGFLAVNGMSYQARDGENANSALIVTVRPEDFPDGSPLGGVAFQRELERAAYQAGGGKIPLQTFGDFCEGRVSDRFEGVRPAMKGGWAFANVREIFAPGDRRFH